MKKINKIDFLKIIDLNINKIDVNTEIESKFVTELKIGKNFMYHINNDKLKNIQKRIAKYFLKEIDLNNCAVAYRNNYSYFHLLEPHKSNYNFLRLDIKSFFYSISIDDIKKCFQNYFEDSYINDDSLIDVFINLITYKVPKDSNFIKYRDKYVLPIGFITSPLISNIIFRKLDIQIQKFCSKNNIIYTRYADDMLFSAEKNSNYINSESFLKEIKIILFQMEFKLNLSKTIKKQHTLSLNGYTIQHSKYSTIIDTILEKRINEIRLSNKKTYIINKLITMVLIQRIKEGLILKKLFNINCISKKHEYDQLIHKTTGYRSFLISIIKFNNKYQSTTDETINKYLKMIEKMNKIINILNDKRNSCK
jgi:RNA-directed DNA polymerase